MSSQEDADRFLETGFREADIFDSADIISTVEFDHTGNYLATGDKGGRVVLFERNETVSRNIAKNSMICCADIRATEENL